MGIDLDVIPLVGETVPLAAVLDCLAGEGMTSTFRKLGTERQVRRDEGLEIDGAYEVGTSGNLMLYVNPTDEDDEDYEQDMLEEYGRNRSALETEEVCKQWAKVGYSFTVSSGVGRTREDSSLQKHLVAALARATNGFVIVEDNDVLSLSIGIYPPGDVIAAQVLI